MRKLLGRFGVDSGQVMICDPCYLKDWKADEFQSSPDESRKRKWNRTKKFSYDGACRETLSEDMGGELENGTGVISSTGFGDGEYEVWAEISDEGDWGKRIKSLHIEFF